MPDLRLPWRMRAESELDRFFDWLATGGGLPRALTAAALVACAVASAVFATFDGVAMTTVLVIGVGLALASWLHVPAEGGPRCARLHALLVGGVGIAALATVASGAAAALVNGEGRQGAFAALAGINIGVAAFARDVLRHAQRRRTAAFATLTTMAELGTLHALAFQFGTWGHIAAITAIVATCGSLLLQAMSLVGYGAPDPNSKLPRAHARVR